jgi:hypothetical protein
MKFPNFADISFSVRGLLAFLGIFLFVAAVSAQTNPAFVTIVKVANTVDGSGTAITSFPFTASSNFGQTSFNLIDNVPGDGGASQMSAPIVDFGTGNTATVTINEENTFGWTLEGIVCTTNNQSSVTFTVPTQPAPHAGTLIVTTGRGGVTTCTFFDSQLSVTAAPATISGRVLSSSGAPLKSVTVELTDASTGESRIALTNPFGYYVFDNCMTDDFYVLNVKSRNYSFNPSSRSFSLTDNLADVNFVADP